MNNILLGDILNLKDSEFNLNIKKNVVLNISGKVIIKEINKSSSNITYTINLDKDSTLDYYKFDNRSNDIKITVNSLDNSVLNLNYSIITKKTKKIDIINNVNGNNMKSNIIIRGVTANKGSLYIKSNGNVKDDTHGNFFKEDIRILTLNNYESEINPNLEVNSNDIEAVHNATCSGINKEYLLYLESKGISSSKAKDIINRGFILNNILCLEENINL